MSVRLHFLLSMLATALIPQTAVRKSFRQKPAGK